MMTVPILVEPPVMDFTFGMVLFLVAAVVLLVGLISILSVALAGDHEGSSFQVSRLPRRGDPVPGGHERSLAA